MKSTWGSLWKSQWIYMKSNKNKQWKPSNTEICNCELECSHFAYSTELGIKQMEIVQYWQWGWLLLDFFKLIEKKNPCPM